VVSDLDHQEPKASVSEWAPRSGVVQCCFSRYASLIMSPTSLLIRVGTPSSVLLHPGQVPTHEGRSPGPSWLVFRGNVLPSHDVYQESTGPVTEWIHKGAAVPHHTPNTPSTPTHTLTSMHMRVALVPPPLEGCTHAFDPTRGPPTTPGPKALVVPCVTPWRSQRTPEIPPAFGP